MPKDLSSPDIMVRRDEQGNVRQLCHPYEPLPGSVATASSLVALAADPAKLRALAQAYLQECAPLFGIRGDAPSSASVATTAPEFKTSLRLAKVKQAVGQAFAVSFDQYLDEWPVWRAGVTVRIDARRMLVSGSHNAAHLDIRLHRCRSDAPFTAPRIDSAVLKGLLGLGSGAAASVGDCRMLVYQFRLENRLAPQIEEAAPSSEDGEPASARPLPSLPLQVLPSEVLAYEGVHCVVAEALFTLAIRGWGELSWRAFIEPDTGSVLYLRSMVSGATSLVFPRDPTSATGQVLSAASPLVDLEGCRQQVDLRGLVAPNAQGLQDLSGEFVTLVNVDDPPVPMPSQAHPFKFEYGCASEPFAACSAYYHCDGVFRWIQELGIDVRSYFSNTHFPVAVDPHAFRRGVNAQALGRQDGKGLAQLRFGSARDGSTLGIASDVRVVLHEFGHALLWEHIGSPNFVFAHSPGDSLAAILMDPFSTATDRGHTYPFQGDGLAFDRRHDRKIGQGWGWSGNHWDREYGGEQVLSTTLFRVYLAAGGASSGRAERELASRYVCYLILASIALLDISPEHAEVLVDALTEADASTVEFEGFAGGALGKVFRWAFEQQGLYKPPTAPFISFDPGARPAVDVYIDDGRDGAYLPYLEDFQRPPGLWNRVAQDGVADNQEPVVSVPNFAYVRVRNRGGSPAQNVEVAAFQMPDVGLRRWGTDWAEVPSSSRSIQAPIPAGGETIVGPIAWTPMAPHDHLLVHVSAPGDRSSLRSVNPAGLPVDCFVRLDNNIVERRF